MLSVKLIPCVFNQKAKDSMCTILSPRKYTRGTYVPKWRDFEHAPCNLIEIKVSIFSNQVYPESNKPTLRQIILSFHKRWLGHASTEVMRISRTDTDRKSRGNGSQGQELNWTSYNFLVMMDKWRFLLCYHLYIFRSMPTDLCRPSENYHCRISDIIQTRQLVLKTKTIYICIHYHDAY